MHRVFGTLVAFQDHYMHTSQDLWYPLIPQIHLNYNFLVHISSKYCQYILHVKGQPIDENDLDARHMKHCLYAIYWINYQVWKSILGSIIKISLLPNTKSGHDSSRLQTHLLQLYMDLILFYRSIIRPMSITNSFISLEQVWICRCQWLSHEVDIRNGTQN